MLLAVLVRQAVPPFVKTEQDVAGNVSGSNTFVKLLEIISSIQKRIFKCFFVMVPHRNILL